VCFSQRRMIMIVIEIHLPLSAVANASGIYHFVLLGYCELMSRIGDYRTIDWVHDSVKEQFRKKALRSMTGFRGFIVNMFDSMEGWIIVGIIGTTHLQIEDLLLRLYHSIDCILH